ncbi:hypothetical protein NPIL_424101 [Nephila pilipes]|uniref:Uncharacterized protein n=1 Tax=Nephila pilipes TaxID=299642 RepID=A0A8X6UKJ7_NEPPI|nr:hypothetical protein NPIL_424101 [Nephila pilipes]
MKTRYNEESSLSNYSDWNNLCHRKESSPRIVFRFLGSHKHSPECSDRSKSTSQGQKQEQEKVLQPRCPSSHWFLMLTM